MLRGNHIEVALKSGDYSPRVMVAVKNENGDTLGVYPALAAMPGTRSGETDGTMVIIIEANNLHKKSSDD